MVLTERGERAEQLEAAGVEVAASPRLARHKGSLVRYPAHVALATNNSRRKGLASLVLVA